MILTFEQQNDLVAKGLATRKDNGKLSTFKYARKAMFNYLWDKHPELLECRGHTYDNTNGKLVVAAPTKTFNYLENGTWKAVDTNIKVKAYKKYNGFMAALSVYEGEVIVSTTGTTTSDYAKLARQEIFKQWEEDKVLKWPEGYTWLFEICHKSDPHIVKEKQAAYYLGGRSVDGSNFQPVFTDSKSFMQIKTLRDAIEYCKTDKGEGFMLYDEAGNCCKLKTDYYVGKKKLMRMSKSKTVATIWNNPKALQDTLPDCWKSVVDYILTTQTKEDWLEMTDQQRRAVLETTN